MKTALVRLNGNLSEDLNMKHLVKFKLDGNRKQKTIESDSIYNAEREIRKQNYVSEYSKRIEVITIKCGRKEYQVNGTVLG